MGLYVLTERDVAAMVVISAIARLIPGVIKLESLKEESFFSNVLNVEYPHYTRPEVFVWPVAKGKKYSVPRVLLSGNHAKIEAWRKSKMK